MGFFTKKKEGSGGGGNGNGGGKLETTDRKSSYVPPEKKSSGYVPPEKKSSGYVPPEKKSSGYASPTAKESIASEYVSPALQRKTAEASNATPSNAASTDNQMAIQESDIFERNDSDDEEMAIIERTSHAASPEPSLNPSLKPKKSVTIATSLSGPSEMERTTSEGVDTKDTDPPSIDGQPTYDSAFAFIKEGPLPNANSIVNGHLIQWKFYSEDGSALLRIPVLIATVTIIVNTILAYSLFPLMLTDQAVIISTYVILAAACICVLDGRFFCNLDPLSIRGKLRNMIVRNGNMLRYVWGRGVLYIWLGVLHYAQDWTVPDNGIVRRMQLIVAGAMVLLGMIAIAVGVQASYNLKKLRAYVTDESALWFDFSRHDSDGDGYLSPTEFAHFIWELGLEFDDVYTLKAFNMIDKDRDCRITFEEFRVWWMKSSFQATPRERRNNFENPYHRFE